MPMTDAEMLLEMASCNWRNCRCEAPLKQTGPDVKIDLEGMKQLKGGVGWNHQLPCCCSVCGKGQRFVIVIDQPLARAYDEWREAMKEAVRNESYVVGSGVPRF